MTDAMVGMLVSSYSMTSPARKTVESAAGASFSVIFGCAVKRRGSPFSV